MVKTHVVEIVNVVEGGAVINVYNVNVVIVIVVDQTIVCASVKNVACVQKMIVVKAIQNVKPTGLIAVICSGHVVTFCVYLHQRVTLPALALLLGMANLEIIQEMLMEGLLLLKNQLVLLIILNFKMKHKYQNQ